jgi:MFS transporter, APGE family, 1-arseno-3-phosphoglycerate exporter
VRQYAIITASYWGFTLTDGALRMLVVLYFHQLGYSPLQIALLFIFYEVFGIVTNLFGGYMAARLGLAATLLCGLALQIGALSMLLVESAWLTVPYVMAAQALSGIAKDLNKMSAKSGVKLVLPEDAQGKLYRWVAALTGSKNALKGLGFFLGGVLLELIGFRAAIATLAGGLVIVGVFSFFTLDRSLGRTPFKARFKQVFSKSEPVNWLSAARLFLFGARDVWFVVALPVYLQLEMGWTSTSVGTLLALWIIGYGAVQVFAPRITGLGTQHTPDGRTVVFWGAVLLAVTVALLGATVVDNSAASLVFSLMIFGLVFAINSSVHSYLIVAYAQRQSVSLDVGFYYMSNAAGRLIGTVLSGVIYQAFGLAACLLVSAAFIFLSTLIAGRLPRLKPAA